MNQQINPLLAIGGLGGSGTRIVAEIIKKAGIYIGTDLNQENDNLLFTRLFKCPTWYQKASEEEIVLRFEIFQKAMLGLTLSSKEQQETILAFEENSTFSTPKDYQPIQSPPKEISNWGWKEPNSHIYLKSLAAIFPETKYVHVVRNGMDMAFSSNMQQLTNWGELIFDIKSENYPTKSAAQMEYWILANKKAIAEGRKYLGERFYFCNYDLLCQQPKKEVSKLLRFLGISLPKENEEELISLPKIQASSSRYKKEDLTIFSVDQLHEVKKMGFDIPDLLKSKTLKKQSVKQSNNNVKAVNPIIMKDKKCILILGMHRSGTSALAGSLNLLDIDFGKSIVKPSFDNPKGFFENEPIQQLNDQLLKELGVKWSYPGFLKDNWWNLASIKKYEKSAKEIVLSEFGNSTVFSIKDPRICLLFPFWERVLKSMSVELNCLFITRNFLEIAASVKKRNNLPKKQSLLITAAHLLSAELHSRSYPRVFITYTQLLETPSASVALILNEFKIQPTKKQITDKFFADFLQPSLKHHTLTDKQSFPAQLPYLEETENLLKQISKKGKTTKVDLETFDDYRSTHADFTDLFYDGILGVDNHFSKLLIDSGKGFNERESFIQSIDTKKHAWDINLSKDYDAISTLRFLPANIPCLIEIKHLDIEFVDGGKFTVETNAIHVDDNTYFFDTPFPVINIFFDKPVAIEKFLLSLEYQHLGEQVQMEIQKYEFQKLLQRNQLEIESKENTIKEREGHLQLLNSDILSLQKSVTLEKDSFNKLTKEMEKVLEAERANTSKIEKEMQQLLANEKKESAKVIETLRKAIEIEKADKVKQAEQLRKTIEAEKDDKVKQAEQLRQNFQKEVSTKINEKDKVIAILRKTIEAEKDDKVKQAEQLRQNFQKELGIRISDKEKQVATLRMSIETERNEKIKYVEQLRNNFQRELQEKDKLINALNDNILKEKDERIKSINSLRSNIEAQQKDKENALFSLQNAKEKELLTLSDTKEKEAITLMKDLIAEIKEREDQIKIEKDERFKAIESLRNLLENERKEKELALTSIRLSKENEIKELKDTKEISLNTLREAKEKEVQEKQAIINQLHFNYESERNDRINDIEKLSRELKHFQSLYIAKEEEIDYAEEVINYHKEEMEYMRLVYKEREKDIEALKGSLSHKIGWTLTAPGRWIYNFVFRKNKNSQSKVVVDLALNGAKQPKQLIKSINRDNIATLKKALKTEDSRLILKNYNNLLDRNQNGSSNHIADAEVEIKYNPNKKSVLFISPNLPEYDESAGGKRALWMLKLMQEEYQVYAYTKGHKAEHHRTKLEEEGIIVIDTHNFEQLKKRIRHFEAIIYAWYYTMFDSGELIQFYPEAKIIVDTVDVHWVREERSLGNWDGVDAKSWADNKAKEIGVYERADLIWAVSETDKKAILKEIPNADIRVVSIIEEINETNYVDPQTNNILFLGGYRHYPNISAVKILAEEMFPAIKAAIPDAKLLIAGANAPDDVKALGEVEGIEFLGFIEDEDIDDLYAKSFISIVPLIAGAGVKGKICQAISYRVPVVTNDIGNEGINLENNKDAFITNDTKEMVDYTINAMKRSYNLDEITKSAQGKFLDLVGPAVNKERMINSMQTQVSICIVTYNKVDLLEKCIASILNHTKYQNYKVLVWSNGCEDGTREYLNAVAKTNDKIIPILSETNEVFVIPNNKMMKMFPDNDAVLLNNDVEVTENWLTALHEEAYSSSKVGIVGSKILFPDGKLQEFGGELYVDGTGRNIGKWEDPDQMEYKRVKHAAFVSGCSFYVKKSTIEQIGVFDEDFHPCYCEDADYCYTAWENGIETKVTPYSIIFHYEGGTAGTDTSSGFKKYQTINMKKFLKKHKDNLEAINNQVREKNGVSVEA